MMWTMVADKDISWEHCGRPAYWEGDDVYCSKCQTPLIDSTLTTTERKAMNTYEFRGSYIYIVQAESEEDAINQMDAGFQEMLFDWDIRETFHQEEE